MALSLILLVFGLTLSVHSFPDLEPNNDPQLINEGTEFVEKDPDVPNWIDLNDYADKICEKNYELIDMILEVNDDVIEVKELSSSEEESLDSKKRKEKKDLIVEELNVLIEKLRENASANKQRLSYAVKWFENRFNCMSPDLVKKYCETKCVDLFIAKVLTNSIEQVIQNYRIGELDSILKGRSEQGIMLIKGTLEKVANHVKRIHVNT